MKRLLCVALIVSMFVLPAFGDDDKYIVVEAEGRAETRLEAVNAALLEAIRTAAGQFIDAKTELNNDELNERIISYSRGLVSGYDVISEDGTRADEGIYYVKIRVRVERDLLRDGVKVATNKTAMVSFRPEDIKPQKDELDPTTIETTDAITRTKNDNAASGVELLSAMLERYNPEDFITFHINGKVTPVKDKDDFVQVLVDVAFNDKLYNESFIPDLKQVLDVIASGKKDITLTKQRDTLRRISSKKGAPLSDSSVIMSGAGLGKDYQLAVYDKPDRFGCRLYSFKKEDADKILNNQTGILAQFRSRIARVKGFEIELLDENDELVDTSEQKISVAFLLTDNVIRNNVWAFHPTIMAYQGMFSYVPLYLENSQVTIPLQFELPEEFQKLTKNIKANLMLEDDYSDAWLKTRAGLHDTALNYLTKGQDIARSVLEEAAESEYPLALSAVQSINAADVMKNDSLLLNEAVDRLEEGREAGNYAAIYYTFLKLEADNKNFESQKKAVPYLTQAAMVSPVAMIRMGEVQEQGFYDVKPNPKRAKAYYDEGIRILSLLASQGLPSAAVVLGHVYIEGLGTKQDIPRAERYYNFAKKAGYYDPEFWVWEHYGVTMRQVSSPHDIMAEIITQQTGAQLPIKQITLVYLVRERLYSPYGIWYSGGRADFFCAPVSDIAEMLRERNRGSISLTCYEFSDGKLSGLGNKDFKFNADPK